jgi:hypothetical protein
MNTFKQFKTFKPINPLLVLPRGRGGGRESEVRTLKPPKRFERSAAIERLERFEPERR